MAHGGSSGSLERVALSPTPFLASVRFVHGPADPWEGIRSRAFRAEASDLLGPRSGRVREGTGERGPGYLRYDQPMVSDVLKSLLLAPSGGRLSNVSVKFSPTLKSRNTS